MRIILIFNIANMYHLCRNISRDQHSRHFLFINEYVIYTIKTKKPDYRSSIYVLRMEPLFLRKLLIELQFYEVQVKIIQHLLK